MVQTNPEIVAPTAATRPASPSFGASGAGADERRREILAAASRLFRERGFAATGMRDIAAALGVTAGSLYYYFESKEALLAFCQESTLDALDGTTAKVGSTAAVAERRSGGPAGRRLRELVVAHVVALNETHPGSLAHLEIEALGGERRAPLLRKRRAYERRIEALLRDGVANGELAVDDPRLATLALLGALNWTVKWFRADGGRSAREVGERFADLFLDGLVAREPAR